MSSQDVRYRGAVPEASPRRRARPPAGNVHGAVLSAGERLLADRSLDEVTVGDLAAEAGVSRASFYFYFESKQAVLAALLESVLAEVSVAASPWLERDRLDPAQALREAVGGSVAVWRRHGAVLRAAVESSRSVPEIGELWRTEIGKFIDAAAGQIERDRAAGAAPPDDLDPHALAASLIWMNERTFYVMSMEDPAGDEQLIETIAAVWLRAVYRA